MLNAGGQQDNCPAEAAKRLVKRSQSHPPCEEDNPHRVGAY